MLLVKMVNAQTFGIKGGVNFANMTISAMGIGVTPKSLTGVHVGFVGDFELQNSLFFNTGLLYSLKGFKMSASGETLSESLNYLVVPLNLEYKFPLNEKSKFMIQAGPYLGYALSGKNKNNGESSNVRFGGEGGMKRFDYGLGFGAGVEFGALVTSLNYELGLAKIVDSGGDGSAKNKVLQISVAYLFGSKK